jgi:hypothetical protein
VTTVNESSGMQNAHDSNSHVTYQNVVISLKSRGLKINTIADLAKLSVTGFQEQGCRGAI